MVSHTGGVKGAKPEAYHLLPFDSLAAVARVYNMGAEKYEPHNWRRGYPWSLSFSAAMRHMAAFWEGEDLDAESGEPHVAHAVFHMLALLAYMKSQREFDDRPTTKPPA